MKRYRIWVQYAAPLSVGPRDIQDRNTVDQQACGRARPFSLPISHAQPRYTERLSTLRHKLPVILTALLLAASALAQSDQAQALFKRARQAERRGDDVGA